MANLDAWFESRTAKISFPKPRNPKPYTSERRRIIGDIVVSMSTKNNGTCRLMASTPSKTHSIYLMGLTRLERLAEFDSLCQLVRKGG